MKRILKKVAIWIVILTVSSVIAMSLLPGSRKKAPTLGSKIANEMRELGIALTEYKKSHSTYPENLSELIPEYVPPQNIKIFYPYRETMCKKPLNWKTDVKLIDTSAQYTYFGNAPLSGNILLATKPECLDSIGVILFIDISVVQYPKPKFLKLLDGSIRNNETDNTNNGIQINGTEWGRPPS